EQRISIRCLGVCRAKIEAGAATWHSETGKTGKTGLVAVGSSHGKWASQNAARATRDAAQRPPTAALVAAWQARYHLHVFFGMRRRRALQLAVPPVEALALAILLFHPVWEECSQPHSCLRDSH